MDEINTRTLIIHDVTSQFFPIFWYGSPQVLHIGQKFSPKNSVGYFEPSKTPTRQTDPINHYRPKKTEEVTGQFIEASI